MLRSALAAVLVSWMISAPAIAGDEFPFCKAGEDTSITNGQPAREFFAARAAQTDCRAALDAAKTAFYASPTEANRDALLEKVEACGDCATKAVTREVQQTPGGTKAWYIADGACHLGSQATRTGYEKARDSLKLVKQYPQHSNGFDALLEFLPVNPATGEWRKDVEKVEPFPFYAFVALRGPKILSLAYTQLFKITWDESADATSVVFDGVRAPRGFTAPEVNDHGKRLAQLRLAKVYARWQLTPDGYVRYCSAGDFGPPLPSFALEAGRQMERDTIFTMAERFVR